MSSYTAGIYLFLKLTLENQTAERRNDVTLNRSQIFLVFPVLTLNKCRLRNF